VQDRINVLAVDISQCNDPVAIQAARHDRAVNQNAEVIRKTVAKHLISLHGRVFVGPLKAVTPLNMELITDANASRILPPITRKATAKVLAYHVISAIVMSPIPEAKHHNHALR
jgi:hypothetical protein